MAPMAMWEAEPADEDGDVGDLPHGDAEAVAPVQAVASSPTRSTAVLIAPMARWATASVEDGDDLPQTAVEAVVPPQAVVPVQTAASPPVAWRPLLPHSGCTCAHAGLTTAPTARAALSGTAAAHREAPAVLVRARRWLR